MNILTDELPYAVDILGSKVPITWGFRASIKFSEIMMSDIPADEKILKGADIYYGKRAYDFSEKEAYEGIKKMLWFYSGGSQLDDDEEIHHGKTRKQKRIYSFDEDGDYIYSAFREQFNVDLTKETLHWWQFRALFSCISSSTRFGKILEFRSADLSKISNSEEREYYRKMQKEYALKRKTDAKERKLIDDINSALMRGDDISELLKG